MSLTPGKDAAPATQLKSIMVIEDDHDTRVSLRRMLEAEGYFVFSAADGRQGLELLRRIRPPCLILLDVIMPMMNGPEFLAAIQTDPTLHVIPVIVVSAFPEDAKKMVARAFVRKPIDLQLLIDVVHTHCTCPDHATPAGVCSV